jgi:hypothetical protein
MERIHAVVGSCLDLEGYVSFSEEAQSAYTPLLTHMSFSDEVQQDGIT